MSIDAQREQLAQQADVMFSKIGAYMEAELGGTATVVRRRGVRLTRVSAHAVVKEDYLLLQHMNKLAKTNYADMSQLTEHLNVLMTSLQEKCALAIPSRAPIVGAPLTLCWRQTRSLSPILSRLTRSMKTLRSLRRPRAAWTSTRSSSVRTYRDRLSPLSAATTNLMCL